MRMLRALFTFSAVFSIFLSYRLLSFFCLFIPNPPSFFPYIFDNRDRRWSGTGSLASSLGRALAHAIAIRRYYSWNIISSNIHHQDCDALILCTGETRNRTAYLGRMHGRRISIRQREFYALTRKNLYAIIKLIHDTHTHTCAIYIHTYIHMGTYVKTTMPLCSHYLHPRTKAHEIEWRSNKTKKIAVYYRIFIKRKFQINR